MWYHHYIGREFWTVIDFMIKEFISEVIVKLKKARQKVSDELVSTVPHDLQWNQKGGDCRSQSQSNVDQRKKCLDGWNSWESLWSVGDRWNVWRWGQSYLILTSASHTWGKKCLTPSVKKKKMGKMDTRNGPISSNFWLLSKCQVILETLSPADMWAPVVESAVHLRSVSPDLGTTDF